MKQISYSYNLDQLMASLIDDINDIEDGYYKLSFLLETVPAVLDKMHPSQRDGFFPGTICRIVGVELIGVEGPGPLILRVLDGMVVVGTIAEEFNAIDTDSGGFVEDGEIAGENSDFIGESNPSRGRRGLYTGALPKRPGLIRSIIRGER